MNKALLNPKFSNLLFRLLIVVFAFNSCKKNSFSSSENAKNIDKIKEWYISAALRDEAEKRLEERLGYMANQGGTVIENAYLEILGGLMALQGGRVSRAANYGTVPISPLKKGFRGGTCNSVE